MKSVLQNLREIVEEIDGAPDMAEMPRRTLSDKGICGPTAAHVIEEVHTPYNFAYLTFTTGSSAMQNIVGVTPAELPQRLSAVRKLMALAEIPAGSYAVCTYPPLINVFSQNALIDCGLSWRFLQRSSRDAMILALAETKPQVIMGESAFISSTLADAENLGLSELLPRDCIVLCTGTPLDLELLELAKAYNWQVHDLYGCQEFGWLVLDGIALRDDIALIPSPLGQDYRELVVGGMPLADSFIISDSGHVCNKQGKIITYRRRRTEPEYEVLVCATTLPTSDTLIKAARSILRIKGRVVKVSPDVRCNAQATELKYLPGVLKEGGEFPQAVATITGPEKTVMFDSLLEAQIAFQSSAKRDPTWIKKG